MSVEKGSCGRLAFLLGVAAIAIPIFLSLWFVTTHAIDVPYWDEWEAVVTLQRWLHGELTFGELFQQHNEHRILVPQILMLLIDRATAMDIRARMAVSWMLLAATVGLLFADYRRVHPEGGTILLRFAPVVWLVLSLRQWENLLWGWQITLCSCVFFLVAGLCALIRARSLSFLLLAVAVGACASLSFSNGLLIWPLGLLLLLGERRRLPARALVVWAIAGAGVFAAYFVNYAKPAGHPTLMYMAFHPGPALQYLVASLGSPLAVRLRPALWAGGFVVALSAAVAVLVLRGRLFWRSPLPPMLLLFALASSALITLGRAGMGPEQALSSRYSTFAGLGLVGLYLLLLEAPSRLARPLTAVLLALVAAAQPGIDKSAFQEARALAAARQQARTALAHFREEPDARLLQLYPWPVAVRERAVFLESNHLSVFRYIAGEPQMIGAPR
jgi:hypothetical protein